MENMLIRPSAENSDGTNVEELNRAWLSHEARAEKHRVMDTGDTTDDSNALSPSTCPAWDYSWHQIRTRSELVRWCMSTKACYIPMLEPGYKCDIVHTLAIQGKKAFSSLQHHLGKHPRAVNCKDSLGNTLLMLACAAHDEPYDVVRFLLAASQLSLVKAENHEGLTALHFAVLNDQPDIVELLLREGARVDAGSRQIEGKTYGLTPLHLALIHRVNTNESSKSCFHILLDHGADISVERVNYPVLSGISGAKLRLECNCGGCRSMGITLDGVVPPARIQPSSLLAQDGYQTAFLMAVDLNNNERVRTLLERFPCLKNSDSTSGLCYAIANCNIRMIRLLLDNGADVNGPFPKEVPGSTALHVLLTNSSTYVELTHLVQRLNEEEEVNDVYDSLLKRKELDIHRTDAHGRTALSMAVASGHVYACRKLLDMGADPLYVSRSGESLLSLACKLYDSPYVCEPMLCTLMATGLGHHCRTSGAYKDTQPLQTVYNNLDSASLHILYEAGAVSRDTLQHMLVNVEIDSTNGSPNVARDRFCQTLESLLREPQSLKTLTLLHFSKLAGLGSPSQREHILRSVDPDPKGAAFTLMKSVMEKNDFL